MKRSAVLLSLLLILPAGADAQRQPQSRTAQREDYDPKFFDQLRRVFGRFRDADLRDVFDMGGPIACSELINDKGEWREVAFFNEDRKLGDWYRRSLDEVRVDPSLFTFKGPCADEHGSVDVTTQFPVDESAEAYQRDRIRFDQIVVNVNAPVRANFNSRTQTYWFDLPYLFLINRQGSRSLYSLNPPTLAGRRNYAKDVYDHWSCRAVVADDVTYQFLICRTTTENVAERGRGTLPFGASAYFILSDGKEASSSVKLLLGDDTTVLDSDNRPNDRSNDRPNDRPIDRPNDRSDPSPATRAPERVEDTAREGWQIPGGTAKLAEVGQNEFRIRFSPQTWTGKINSPQILADQKLSSAESLKPAVGADYCAWRPGTANSFDRLLARDPDELVGYSVKGHDKDRQSDSSVTFELKTHTGFRLGVLQCFFPKSEFAGSVPLSRWVSVVGAHLTIEIRP